MSVHVLIGQDNLSKDAKLKNLKSQFLTQSTEQFNWDMLYARELHLKDLQEKLLSLPLGSKKRMVVIRGAASLKKELKDFIARYVKEPSGWVILVLDIDHFDPKDEFIRSLSRHARIYRFKEEVVLNTFTLSRQIELRRADFALRTLSGLLSNGEKPERIMGGLRYSWERSSLDPRDLARRLKRLLRCDIEIKTGRLKPVHALEKLIVELCCLVQPQH